MNKVIIPWPMETISDFQKMNSLLSEVGIVTVIFVLKFIFDHGTHSWARNYGDIESWINCYLNEHLKDVGQRLIDKNYNSQLEYYTLTCYYDNMHDLAAGDCEDFDDVIYGMVAILRNYYSFISLPEMETFSHLNVTDMTIDGNYVIVTLTKETGDVVNAFYNQSGRETQDSHVLSLGRGSDETFLGLCG